MVSQNPKCGGDHYINVKQRSISVSCQGMKGRYVGVRLPGPSRILTLCEVLITLAPNDVPPHPAMEEKEKEGDKEEEKGTKDRAMEMWNQIKVSKMFWLVLGSGLLILVLVVTGVILIIGFAPGGRSQVENVMSRSGQQNSSTSWSSPSYKQTSSPVVSSTSFSSLSGWRPTGSETDTHRGNTEILLTTIAPLATTAPCPDDYQKYHDVCYKVFATPKTFSDSSVTCETAGGTLAMPRDAGTNTFLISIMNKNRHADAWIGLHDRKREGRWMWIDGTPSRTGYTAWGPGEPNNQNGKQDCAMYWTANRSLWDDAYCNREEKFICQVKPSGQ
ncbi:pulmonary surfactant-associated protein D-like [Branchiostoma floridae]|uniref:Pulmonary surfactant-associated protein D-like n=1 Tax=Branchiostoma floridae TaxID=7739 RepID=A0A9J7LLW7_BRAFL|nr:pulmonary surfactant-associated protein D-like [Branchiostoma floridae]